MVQRPAVSAKQPMPAATPGQSSAPPALVVSERLLTMISLSSSEQVSREGSLGAAGLGRRLNSHITPTEAAKGSPRVKPEGQRLATAPGSGSAALSKPLVAQPS